MKTYRKKPVYVQAQQWNLSDDVDGIRNLGTSGLICLPNGTSLEVFDGDWIIYDEKGVIVYTMSDGVFRYVFEEVG